MALLSHTPHNKFIALLTDEVSNMTYFISLPEKLEESFLPVIFVKWICKLLVPQVIDTDSTQCYKRFTGVTYGRKLCCQCYKTYLRP